MPYKDPEVRFLMRTNRTQDGCLEWVGQRGEVGYGRFYAVGKRWVLAHRWAYERWVGPIPDGLVIDHLCRNTACVEPSHLEPVTTWENVVMRGIGPSALNARKTHCLHGHEFTAENTYRHHNGGRQCRTCRKERQRNPTEAQRRRGNEARKGYHQRAKERREGDLAHDGTLRAQAEAGEQ